MKYCYLLLAALLVFACQRENSSTTGHRYSKRGGGHCDAYGNKSPANAPSGTMSGAYMQQHIPTKRTISYTNQNTSGYIPGEAGRITAGEVNDLAEWDFWKDIDDEELALKQYEWALEPANRVSFLVQNQNFTPLIGATVQLYGHQSNLLDKPTLLYTSRTDNTGIAHLFGSLSPENDSITSISHAIITYQGVEQIVRDPKRFNDGINSITLEASCNVSTVVDIAFAVDATGSMQDEIDFLKKDLLDIIESSASTHENIDLNLAALFYRCEGNSYVTKHSDFSPKLEKTIDFIKKQNADEGGDEVVAKALDESINKLSWRDNARTKLLFMVLDEPPGSNPEVNKAMKQAYRDAAAKGIKLIPCVASGTSLEIDRSLEYLMRAGAIATGGTYVYFTNDSGIGNNHTLPIVRSVEVEKLNALLKRIISSNLETTPCEQNDGPIASSKDTQSNVDEQTQQAMDSVFRLGSDSLILESLLPYTDFETVAELDSNRPLDRLDTTQFLQDYGKNVVSLKVFPVPTQTDVTVEVTEAPDSYALLDGHGRLMLYVDDPREKTFKVDLSGLPRGTYFLKAVVGETDLTSRIIKL